MLCCVDDVARPRKPIKHGIKVYALCCAETGYVLNFEIYTGKCGDANLSNSPKDVVTRLLEGLDFGRDEGRVVYTDNWYGTQLCCLR